MTHARLTLEWGDGEHDFDLGPIKLLLELEEKCGAGIGAILQRMAAGMWGVNDVREVVRLALIGGGKKPIAAFALTVRYVDDRPLAESLAVAKAVLLAAVVGVPGDNEVGKEAADRTATGPSGSSDPPYTAPAPH